MRDIILASASPRRKELLLQLGFSFEIMPAKGEEIITKSLPEEIVAELSYQKAMEISESAPADKIIIGADTIVAHNGHIMGKPENEEAAFQMLLDIQGCSHQVYTGVTAVIRQEEDFEYFTFFEETKVQVYPMTAKEIRAYIETKEPMDKAGAYGIQGIFARYIRGIDGDYNNVVGLPIGRLYQEMKKRELL